MAIFGPLANLGGGGASFIGIVLLTIFAGSLSVWFYQRRTGEPLTVVAGARLGWITGVFIFALFLVLFTISFIPALESGEIQKLQEAALKQNLSDADMMKVREVFESPVMVSILVILAMVVHFVGATTLTSIGGMLGAKLLRRDQSL